jgi:flagellar hook-associated protein 2
MATITSSGAVSGLNTADLVSQLVAAERAPYEQRFAKTDTKLTTQFTALSKLKASMATFQSALTELKTPAGFQQRKVSVSDDTGFTATATASAAPGSYDVEVVKLAKAAQLSSSPFVGGAATVIGSGTLELSMGSSSFTVTVSPEKNTLADVRDAINASANNVGVRATLIKTADGTRLMLSGAATGDTNAVTVRASGGDGGLAQLAHDPPGTSNLQVVTPASDAVIRVANYEIRSADNSISDAIDGVTLTLKKEDVGTTASLTIATDDAAIEGKVKNFVSAYNALAQTMTSLRSYDPATKAAGPLLGDSMLRGIESQVRRALSDAVSGGSGRYTTLASLGITTNDKNQLTLDSAKFAAAMKADPLAASQLFSASNGIATRLDKVLGDHLAKGGDIEARDLGVANSRKRLDQQKQALETRMAVITQRYQKQFTALDSMLTQMQSTSTYLAKSLTPPG